VVRTAGFVAAVGYAGIAVFQIALLAGAPVGRAAFGGGHPGTLPAGYRAASAIVALLWTVVVLVVLERSRLVEIGWLSKVDEWAIWVAFGITALGVVMNAASTSPWDRFFWAPYAAAVGVACFVVARGAPA
jgi:hypothetical protein